MTRLEQKLRASLQRLGLGGEARLLVAVSGGADSTALLDALARRREPRGALAVAHLNHLLRGDESEADEQFVRELAARLGLGLAVARAPVADRARAERANLEATARRLRYDFLRREAAALGTGAVVLTAHTRDDQAETLLMRLLRGSGAPGLRGIHETADLGGGVRLARPLLAVSRAEVLAHCGNYGLAFRTDATNFSPDLTRSRVRHELLPLLRTFNPRCDEALARAAVLLSEDEACLRDAAAALLAGADQGGALDLGALGGRPAALRRRALRLWLLAARGDLRRVGRAHLAALDALATSGQSGRAVELPGGWRAAREFGLLRLVPPRETRPASPAPRPAAGREVFGDYELTLRRALPRRLAAELAAAEEEETMLLRECAALDGVSWRARAPGDAYAPAGRRRTIKLKTLMIRHKIPLRLRDCYPVLVTAADEVVWAPSLPVARAFAPPDDAAECALIIARRL